MRNIMVNGAYRRSIITAIVGEAFELLKSGEIIAFIAMIEAFI